MTEIPSKRRCDTCFLPKSYNEFRGNSKTCKLCEMAAKQLIDEETAKKLLDEELASEVNKGPAPVIGGQKVPPKEKFCPGCGKVLPRTDFETHARVCNICILKCPSSTRGVDKVATLFLARLEQSDIPVGKPSSMSKRNIWTLNRISAEVGSHAAITKRALKELLKEKKVDRMFIEKEKEYTYWLRVPVKEMGDLKAESVKA